MKEDNKALREQMRQRMLQVTQSVATARLMMADIGILKKKDAELEVLRSISALLQPKREG